MTQVLNSDEELSRLASVYLNALSEDEKAADRQRSGYPTVWYSGLRAVREALLNPKPEPHPYQHLKDAQAAGKTLQLNWKPFPEEEWRDYHGEVSWDFPPHYYRIKPEPDPYAELKVAHAAGKVIQLNIGTLEKPVWENTDPSWGRAVEDYRIKPTPKLVPLTSDDLPPVVWIKQMASNHMELVTVITEEGLLETVGHSSTIEFLDRCRFEWSSDRKTWNSFMKEVEG